MRAKDLQEMYALGFKHGYAIALREAEIKQLEKEIKEIEGKNE